MDTSGISFTALYTGHVWYAHEMSERFLTSPASHALYWALQPVEQLARRVLGTNIADTLLQRHEILDHRLNRLILDNGVTQVLEIACGLSPRGLQFARRHPGLRYVEADLPAMAERKRSLLATHGVQNERHEVVVCNFFEHDTPAALASVLSRCFDTQKPIVILTEGLVNYFELPVISSLWRQIAELTRPFPSAWYLTDLYPDMHGRYTPLVRAAAYALAAATRSEVSFHFRHDDGIVDGFRDTGFSDVTVHRPEDYYDRLPIPRSRGNTLIRVVEARS